MTSTASGNLLCNSALPESHRLQPGQSNLGENWNSLGQTVQPTSMRTTVVVLKEINKGCSGKVQQGTGLSLGIQGIS